MQFLVVIIAAVAAIILILVGTVVAWLSRRR